MDGGEEKEIDSVSSHERDFIVQDCSEAKQPHRWPIWPASSCTVISITGISMVVIKSI
jgi:hypothetical protein